MASISTDGKGNRRILFVAPDGTRKAVRLGRVPMKQPEEINRRVELLLSAILMNTAVDRETAAWVGGLDDKLARKLEAAGLIHDRQPGARACPTLAEFIEEYKDQRPDVSRGTRTNYGIVGDRLTAFFGKDRRLGDITPAMPTASATSCERGTPRPPSPRRSRWRGRCSVGPSASA